MMPHASKDEQKSDDFKSEPGSHEHILHIMVFLKRQHLSCMYLAHHELDSALCCYELEKFMLL